MPFKPGYDPNRYQRRSQNPATAGAEVVRMDPSAISQYQRVKNPSVFASTGSWGGTNKGDVWGTFKSVTFVERDQWTKTSQVSRKAEDQW